MQSELRKSQVTPEEFHDTNTIFDDVFRTMEERMPQLLIPVINEVFATAYDMNEKIVQFRNEHHTKSGKIITDSCFNIKEHLYHIECQSRPDSAMAVRMVEYDFSIALENMVKRNGIYEMRFPRSAVIYLRQTKNTPDVLNVKIIFESWCKDGEEQSVLYEVPIVKVKNYTKNEIFQKKLLLFLPFYIMRYENKFQQIEEKTEEMHRLLLEYEDIRSRLESELQREKKSVMYSEILELIVRISDYMLKSRKKLKEGIGAVMGGKVLELQTEKRFLQGIQQGENTFAKLITILLEAGKIEDAQLAAADETARKEFYKKYGIIE